MEMFYLLEYFKGDCRAVDYWSRALIVRESQISLCRKSATPHTSLLLDRRLQLLLELYMKPIS